MSDLFPIRALRSFSQARAKARNRFPAAAYPQVFRTFSGLIHTLAADTAARRHPALRQAHDGRP